MAVTGKKTPGSRFPSFRHLRMFDAVARCENLSRAAIEANMSQPAVTQALMRIEDWAGTKLFQRGWTGTFLMPGGRILHGHVRRMFEQVETALGDELLSDAPTELVRTVASRLKGAHIDVLAAISASASFDDAAQAVAQSRTAVQRTARELERIIGCSLYERSASGLIASAAAGRLAAALLLACRGLSEALDEIAGLSSQVRSRLFIGVQRVVCPSLLASAVNDVLRTYPSIPVKIIEGSYRQLLHALRSGHIDMVFGALDRAAQATDLIEEALFDDPYCIAGRRDHPLLRKSHIDLEDCARLDWVLPGSDSQRSRVFARMFSKAQHRPASCMTVSAIGTQVSILTSSDRVTLLPRFELGFEPQFNGLAALPFEPQIPRTPDGLTMRADWIPSPVQACFRARLRRRIGTLGLSLQKPAASTSDMQPHAV